MRFTAARHKASFWLDCLLATISLLAQPAASAHEVPDMLGRVQQFDAVPRRIVSLLPSMAETLCALDACDRLVGVDRYTTHPAQVLALPQVGGNYDPSIERIVSLKPDLVVMPHAPRVSERLEALGIRTMVMDAMNLRDVRRVFALTDQVLQQNKHQAVLRRLEDELAEVARNLAHMPRQRVYVEVDGGLYTAARPSFIGELLHLLGAENIAGEGRGNFPKLNAEFIVGANPELIITTYQARGDEIAHRPGWSGIRAVRSGRLCLLAAHDREVVIRPGPRLGEAARALANCLRLTSSPP